MASKALSKSSLGVVAVVPLLALLLTALHFMSNAIENSEQLDEWFVPLLIFIVTGLVTMVLLIGWNLFRLLQAYRKDAAGSRLMARMIVLFVMIALPPAGIVYYYSLQFLMRGIDSWFDIKVDAAMEDALELNRASISMNKRVLLRVTENFLSNLEDSSQAGLALTIGEIRALSGATEMTLMDRSGALIASSNVELDVLVPQKPDPAIFQQVINGDPYAGITPFGENGSLHIRCVVADQRGFVLRAFYPTSEVVSDLSEKVQSAYAIYRERAYLRESIKFSFTLTLSLVLSLAVTNASQAAANTARDNT
ncbi:MAG: sensor histidine kinase, partial [bacterium]